MSKVLAGAMLAALLATSPAVAADAVKAGQLNIERPTLVSAGFDWRIDGDDNRNASVTVQYRKAGERAWKTGLAFLRAGGNGETVGVGRTDRYPVFNYIVPNMLGFAGKAPDLGAIELGQPMPHYGPRG